MAVNAARQAMGKDGQFFARKRLKRKKDNKESDPLKSFAFRVRNESSRHAGSVPNRKPGCLLLFVKPSRKPSANFLC
jgi:hypothetical protein